MADLLRDYLPQILMFGGLAVGGLLLMRARQAFGERKDLLRDGSGDEGAIDRPIKELLRGEARERSFDGAPVELLRWQVEMHEMARDTKAEIDSKLVMLQALVALAQEERARLEEAIARARKVSTGGQGDPLLTIEQLGQASLKEVNQLLESLPGLAAGEKGSPAALYEKRQAAQQLASAGLSPESISARLGIPLVDLEFLLGVCPPAKKS